MHISLRVFKAFTRHGSVLLEINRTAGVFLQADIV